MAEKLTRSLSVLVVAGSIAVGSIERSGSYIVKNFRPIPFLEAQHLVKDVNSY